MTSLSASLLLLIILIGVVVLGKKLRFVLPNEHLSPDSRDTVKLAMGLVATMTALLLGLLVSSAKGTYDTRRSEIIQMSSAVSFLNRVLSLYGPETTAARAGLRDAVAESIHQMWPETSASNATLASKAKAGDNTLEAIQGLTPTTDLQRELKSIATSQAVEIGRLRMLIVAQAVPSIPSPLLVMVGCWLLIIFLGFSLLAPPNATTLISLTSAVISVAGAVFIIMELDEPLSGIIRISSLPMQNALNLLGK